MNPNSSAENTIRAHYGVVCVVRYSAMHMLDCIVFIFMIWLFSFFIFHKQTISTFDCH